MSALTDTVPGYWAEASERRRVPFVVTLYLVDGHGVARLPPAVERVLDRTVEITGREGLAITNVLDVPGALAAAGRALERAMGMSGVIVLFRCQSLEGSERLMNFLHGAYSLSLLRAA